jgi:hypothetical protein
MTYNCGVIAKKDANIEFRWVVNYGTSTEEVYNYSGVVALEGSAVASMQLDRFCSGGGDCLDGIYIREGGDYSSPPTVTIEANTLPSTPTTLTPTVVGTEVTAVAISGNINDYDYHDPSHRVVFNGVNPRYTYQGTLNSVVGGVTLQPGDTLQLQWKASAASSIRQDDTVDYMLSAGFNPNTVAYQNTTNSVFCTLSVLAMTNDVLLQSLS